jgi:hypothetical protein
MHNLCTIRWMLNNNGHYDGPVNDLSPSYPPLLLIIERVKRRLSYPERLSADAKAGSQHQGGIHQPVRPQSHGQHLPPGEGSKEAAQPDHSPSARNNSAQLFLGLFTCLLTGQTFNTSSPAGLSSVAGSSSTSLLAASANPPVLG